MWSLYESFTEDQAREGFNKEYGLNNVLKTKQKVEIKI